MDKEWRTTDNNTVFDECDECDECHIKRPVKKMLEPFYRNEDFFDDEDMDMYMQFYRFLCYQDSLNY